MTIDTVHKDNFATHSITNYLSASYQGKFAYLNVLAQLSSPYFDAEKLQKTKKALEQAEKWTRELGQGMCLFSAAWTSPQTFEAELALDLLSALKPGLTNLVDQIKQILNLSDIAMQENSDQTTLLVAAYIRFAYSREVYIKGLIEYGKFFKIPEMVQQFSENLVQATDDIRLGHAFLNSLKQPNVPTEPFYAKLREESSGLPAVFRTHLHDINQLLATYRGGLTYANADFESAQGSLWEACGFTALIAGYWRAYDFSAEESSKWCALNILGPALAEEWKWAGFDPQSAHPWVQLGFTPVLAKAWNAGGFSPPEAKENMEKGVSHPSLIRSDI